MDSQLLFGYPINVVPMRKRVPRCQPAMLYVALHARLGDLKLFLSFRWEIQLGLVTHTVQIRYSVVLFHWTLIIHSLSPQGRNLSGITRYWLQFDTHSWVAKTSTRSTSKAKDYWGQEIKTRFDPSLAVSLVTSPNHHAPFVQLPNVWFQ